MCFVLDHLVLEYEKDHFFNVNEERENLKFIWIDLEIGFIVRRR